MLTIIDNVLSQDQIQSFRQQLLAEQWIDGRQTAGGTAAQIKANLQLDDRSETAQTLSHTIVDVLSAHPQFISAALPHKIFPPKFNCYQQGGHYGVHVDNAVMQLPGGYERLRTDLSATLFLSNPDEYDGGELTIETDYGAQTIKLPAGDMIIYPSTSLHQVTEVSQGTRFSAFFWIQSMVRDAQQRAILYDLDQSIQTLTAQQAGPHSEVSRLSAVYHNLIRQWTEL